MSKKRSRMDAHARVERERRRNLLAQPGPSDLILVLDHLKPGFNVAKIRMLADGGEPLQTARLPRRCALVLGHEHFGLGAAALALPALSIAEYGPVQSLNMSVAASIAM